jgi:hypothetical protein
LSNGASGAAPTSSRGSGCDTKPCRFTRYPVFQALFPRGGIATEASISGSSRLGSSFLGEFTFVETGHAVIGSGA